MRLKNLLILSACLSIVLFEKTARAQNVTLTKVNPVLFEGLIVAGYGDHGAYINFAGPGVKVVQKPFSVLVSMLPGLRIKKDKVASGSTNNATLTPSLGFGITGSFKHLALQVPFYYNAKTASKNGKWISGIGLGYKF